MAEEIVAFRNSVNVLKNYPCMRLKKRKGDGEQTGMCRRRIKIREEITVKTYTAPLPPVSVAVTKRPSKVCEQKSPVIKNCSLPPQPPVY